MGYTGNKNEFLKIMLNGIINGGTKEEKFHHLLTPLTQSSYTFHFFQAA